MEEEEAIVEREAGRSSAGAYDGQALDPALHE